MFHESSFLKYLALERRYSPHTIQAYGQDLTMFLNYTREVHCLTSVTEVRHLHIRSWIVQLMEAGQSPRSINRRLSCLKSYFKFLKKRGFVEKDPMAKVIAPKMGKRLPVYIQESQLEPLFNEVDFGEGYQAILVKTIIEVLYATGIRRSELINLRISDMDTSRMVIRVLGKGNKERTVPFASYLIERVEAYMVERQAAFPQSDEPWLFLSKKGSQLSPDFVYYHVKKFLTRVSSHEQRSPHVLRHTFATHLSNAGADLNAIKELLGHSNLSATQIYMHNSIEKLKEVYKQAHPKSEE